MDMRAKIENAVRFVIADKWGHMLSGGDGLIADAVLAAMMEPDEAMVKAAFEAPMPMVHVDSISGAAGVTFKAKWKAAITAARTP